jgi:hypothetical protein
MQKLLAVAGFVGLLALFAVVPVGLAGHPVPFTCNPVGGGGSICRSTEIIPAAATPEDTGIVCGSGADAFDIYDQPGVHTESRTEWKDENGNLTFRQDHDVYRSGQWSNPTTGAIVPYTQHNTEIDRFPTPGDTSTATITFTGENIYRPPTGAPVLLEVGQQVFTWDTGDLLYAHGPNELIGALVGLDPHGLDGICAALGAS